MAFRPNAKSTVSITANTTNQVLALPAGGIRVALVNAGASNAFVEFGGSDVQASAAYSLPILANAPAREITRPAGATHIGVICASGNATVYATVGGDV